MTDNNCTHSRTHHHHSSSSSSSDSLSTSDLEAGIVDFLKYPSPFPFITNPARRTSAMGGPHLLFFPHSDAGGPHHFLDSCHLCHKPLGTGRDIFMYRGDTPFCSEECRSEQIEMDEADERRAKMSKNQQQKQKAGAAKNSTAMQLRAAGTVVAG